MKRVLLSIVCLVVFLSGSHSASAGENVPNMDSNLARLLEEWNTGGAGKASDFARTNLIDMEEGAVQVTLRPERGETAGTIDFDRLQDLGVRIRSRSRSFVSAFVPVGALADVARTGGVAFVRRPLRPLPLAVTDEAVALTGADEYHTAGITGSGVKVAVIDGGFEDWNLARNNGDLPDSVHNYTYDFSGNGLATDTEHGTAVAEAVYDMAPGAEIYLMKIDDSIDLENARDTCVALGIDVINHSMGWFGQPGDGTGDICGIADSAYRAGITWVNSAGNHALGHNEGTFTDNDTDGYHEFGPGDEGIAIQVPFIPGGSLIRVWLTWDAWPATNEDYDLFLVNQSGTIVWAQSEMRQDTLAQKPVEHVSYAAGAGTYYIQILNYSTTTDHDFDLFVMDQDFQTYQVEGGSILSPSDAEGVIAVGAINRNVYTTGPQESFSSQGPTNDGRLKPEICAPDNCDSYSYGPWFGTSLASPHVAGASALLLSAHPAWNPDSLKNGLTSAAIDMGIAGPDSVYGHGRLDFPELTADPLAAFDALPGNEKITLSWTNPSEAAYQLTSVRYSTFDFPASATSGTELGVFNGTPGSDSTAEHTGLTNGTVYYYSAFAHNGLAWSTALTDSATPGDTTAPGAPTFAAARGDTSVVLSWTTPSDPDVAGIKVVYSTVGYPTSPDSGSAVENGNGGIWNAGPSEAGGAVHAGLANDTTYYYSAFAFDGAPNYSTAVQAAATPADTIGPDSPAPFAAAKGDGENLLSWTNPATADVRGVSVRFSTTAYPAGPTEGSPLPNGAGGLFTGSPSAADSFTHGGLVNGTVYYYAAFAYDEVPLYSTAAQATATPADTSAPAPSPSFTAAAGNGQVSLAWTNPSDSDFAHVLIRYDLSTHPAGPTDGSPVENGGGGEFAGLPGSDSSFIHTGLTDSVTYYYSAFAFDQTGNGSAAIEAEATPADTEPPGPVTIFTAAAGAGSVTLSWTNPSSADFSYTEIRYSQSGVPDSANPGTPVENGGSGRFYDAPGSDSSFVHEGLVNGTTLYYAARAYDPGGNGSTPVHVSATPADTTAPGPVTGFAAAAGEGAVTLSWTNPVDTDFLFAAIRYDTSATPATVTDGYPVPGNGTGFHEGTPGESMTFEQTGLGGGITYYYAAFAADGDSNYSASSVDSATPTDVTPPGPLPSFTARAGEDRVTLVWTNPADPDFEAVVIRFNRTQFYPDNPEGGEPVPADSDGVFPGVPGAVDSFVHTGLPDRVPHRYAAFPRDHVPNYGDGSEATATPSDTAAPPAPVAFHATAVNDGSIRLRWTNADAPDLAGTRIVFSLSGPPVTPAAGQPVRQTGSGGFPGAPASIDSFLHEGLLSSATYYYAAFSYDEVPNHSDGAVDSAVTDTDEAPPGLLLGLLPNPYLAAYLDLFLVATESLDPDSVELTVGGTPVLMTRNDPAEEVWMGKAKLAGAGTITVTAEASDIFGNGATVTRFLSYTKIGAGPTTVTSPDGVVTASFEGSAVESWAVLIPSAGGSDRDAALSKALPGDLPAGENSYTIGTAGPWPEGGADLVLRYDPARWSGVPPEEIAVEHSNEGLLAASIDTERSRIATLVTRSGSVRLVRDRNAPTRVAPASLVRLEPNTPNPFNPSTSIRFETGSTGRVRLTVHTLTGRRIRTLLEERLGPGLHEAVWNGTDDGGGEAASGIYLYRIVTENGSEARKMILIR